MNRLKPASEALEEIGYKETKVLGFIGSSKGIRVKMDIRTYPSKKFYRLYSVMFIAAFLEHFGVDIAMSDVDRVELEAVLNFVILAVLHNAAKHGNKSDPQKKILMGWWFGEKGVLVGIRDDGDFFQKVNTEELIKLRRHLPGEKEHSDFDAIYEIGRAFVSRGALYISLLVDSLAPRAKKENS